VGKLDADAAEDTLSLFQHDSVADDASLEAAVVVAEPLGVAIVHVCIVVQQTRVESRAVAAQASKGFGASLFVSEVCYRHLIVNTGRVGRASAEIA
jgi:hypothetical protein